MNCLVAEIWVRTFAESLESGFFFGQAKAGKKEELSSCLQKLRGEDFSIANEIADIQVWICFAHCSSLHCCYSENFTVIIYVSLCIRMQAAMEASNALPSVKLSDLKQRKLYRPLIVSSRPGPCYYFICSTHHLLYFPTSGCQFATLTHLVGTELRVS